MYSQTGNSLATKLPNPNSQIVTIEDLIQLETHLLSEVRKLLKEFSGQAGKKWMKSLEVRKLLKVSPNTLTNMRVNGKLPYTKIGGVIYYDYEDIEAMFKKNKEGFYQ